jgi:hypothetical protein
LGRKRKEEEKKEEKKEKKGKKKWNGSRSSRGAGEHVRFFVEGHKFAQ